MARISSNHCNSKNQNLSSPPLLIGSSNPPTSSLLKDHQLGLPKAHLSPDTIHSKIYSSLFPTKSSSKSWHLLFKITWV
jgi:hypothetical protein